LNQITEVGEDLYVTNCASLIDLEGLNNLNTVVKNLVIRQNNILENINALANLNSARVMTISFNPLLNSLEGLENISSLVGGLFIEEGSIGNLIPLSNLTQVGGYLTISRLNNINTLEGLENLTTIGGRFTVYDCDGLTDLNELENLTHIGGTPVNSGAESILFSENDNLQSLAGLENITALIGDVRITSNDNISDLSAFDNLTEIGGRIFISDNPNLSMCSLPAICTIVEQSPEDAYIDTNLNGCNSIAQVASGCTTAQQINDSGFIAINNFKGGIVERSNSLLDKKQNWGNQIQIFPNPAKDYIDILLPSSNFEYIQNKTFTIYDATGKLIRSTNAITDHQLRIPLNQFKPGFYMVHFDIDKHTIVKRLIILK